MPVYRTSGTLTGTIERDKVGEAQAYLREDDMVKYVAANADLVGTLEWVQWDLASDGYNYTITAVTNRELTDDELKRLSSECSGQNSDGLGEGFEQQPFAETGHERDTWGEDDDEDWGMISFDWQTNDLPFERVK